MSFKDSMSFMSRKGGKKRLDNEKVIAMTESLQSILLDDSLSHEQKEEMIYADVCDFYRDILRDAKDTAEESEVVADRKGKGYGDKEEGNKLKKAMEEVEVLKKAMEMEGLLHIAKEFEILGEPPEELAKTLYELKKSSDFLYNKYLETLQTQMQFVEKSGIFKELGSNRSGSVSNKEQLDDMIRRLMERNPEMTYEQAYIKVCDENPHLKK